MRPVFDPSAVHHLKHKGAVDADGHVLEDAGLWDHYIEAKYRDRALRMKRDAQGLEYLEIGGLPSKRTRKGYPATLGRMGQKDLEAFKPHPDKTYAANMPYGACNADERLKLLDAEGLEAAVLYPTLGILWEAELTDVELSQAYCRAYNRWIADFCRDSKGRLVPIAHVSLSDPAGSALELARAVKDGCRGAFVVPFTWSRLPHGHPDHDALFAAAQDLGVPLAIHPAFEPPAIAPTRFTLMRKTRLLASVTAADGVRAAFTTLFDFGVFDRFPKLNVVVLESGAGWIGYWLDRLDAVYEATFIGERVPLEEKPSHYFKTRCFISADPDERTIPSLAERLGAERFFWASDYPHADHTANYMEEVEELAGLLPEKARRRFLGDNARELYRVEA
jgi:predicted TIM-barrel fold metal-dependent hydrolase